MPPSHPLLLSSFLTSKKLTKMKKGIVVKYAWEEDEDFKIVIVDGVSQKEISARDTTESLPQGVLEDLQQGDGGSTNQSSVSLEGIYGYPIPQVDRGSLLIRKATGIPPHVMLLASMQKVINSQHFFLKKMKDTINLEFDKREVGHATFQVQKQVEQMLTSFEANMITKLDSLGDQKLKDGTDTAGGTTSNHNGGRWYHWGGKYRRVPHDWVFPNKMTLRTAWHRWFLVDHTNQVCPLRYITSTDLHNCKYGRRNISNLKTLMNTLISEAKKKKVFIDNPSKEQLDDMFNLVSGKLFSLTENSRAETLSWHTYIRYLNIAKKKFNYLSYYLFVTFCYYISIRVLYFIIIIMPYYIINL